MPVGVRADANWLAPGAAWRDDVWADSVTAAATLQTAANVANARRWRTVMGTALLTGNRVRVHAVVVRTFRLRARQA